MTDLLIDQNTNDLVIENGDWVLITDEVTLCRQAVVMTLKTFKGEWFADSTFGTPWLANENNPIQILGKVDKGVLDSKVKTEILSNPEVDSIISYTSKLDKVTGKLTINVSVLSPSGSTIEIQQPLQLI